MGRAGPTFASTVRPLLEGIGSPELFRSIELLDNGER